MLTLYHYWDSTCSMKVRFALAVKAIPHDRVLIDLLAFEQMTPAYRAINPNAVVPTLVHDGQTVVESSVINEYLEEVFPERPLLPRASAERARVRALVRLEDGKMMDAVRLPTYALLIKPVYARKSAQEIDVIARGIAASHPVQSFAELWKKGVVAPVDMAAVEKSLQSLGEGMARLEQVLADGRPWLGGDDLTLAEASFTPIVDRIGELGRNAMFDPFPRLRAWRERLVAHTAYKAAIPPVGKRGLAHIAPPG